MRKPETHIIDVDRAMATLDYVEMVALAEMYERWAFTEPNITPEQRTMLIQWSADYEIIAAYSGCGWVASDPESPVDAITFVAREEVQARGLRYVATAGMPASIK